MIFSLFINSNVRANVKYCVAKVPSVESKCICMQQVFKIMPIAYPMHKGFLLALIEPQNACHANLPFLKLSSNRSCSCILHRILIGVNVICQTEISMQI